jgi:DNA-binding response OmpR family regulator
MRILVVDDSPELRDLVVRALSRDGHRVTAVGDVRGADEALVESEFDLVVLDLALPDGWGIEWCRRAREGGLDALVLVLTAHGEVAQRLEGFAAGADDFLAKPFAVAELRARVQALGRRRGGASARAGRTVWRSGDVVVDLARRLATRAGEAAPLTAREWNVIECLARAEGRVVSRAALLDEVWGASDDAAAASLEVLVARIRKKLGAHWIRTARGDGYALGSQ